MRVLVTGGTGHLGRAIASELSRDGHHVRVLARKPRSDARIEWIPGDLATGAGVHEAVAGVDTIINAATNSPAAQRGRFKARDLLGSPRDVDVGGTASLIAAAEKSGVDHFIHVSIVGLERLRLMPYARRKIQAEQLVRGGNVPWTIVRATGFFWLLERLFANMIAQPIVAVPAHTLMAPVDSDDFARFVAAGARDGPRGEREDFAGPQTLSMEELMEEYLEAVGAHRRIRRAPLPRKIQNALTAGNTSPGARLGTTSWSQWLQPLNTTRGDDSAGVTSSALRSESGE